MQYLRESCVNQATLLRVPAPAGQPKLGAVNLVGYVNKQGKLTFGAIEPQMKL